MPGPLGVGFGYIAGLPSALYDPDLLDFIEITVETLCRPRPAGRTTALIPVPERMERVREAAARLPVTVHGVELSIGSFHGMNTACLEMLDGFQFEVPFLWHSEHLGFQTTLGPDGTVRETGVPLPMPPTEEAARLVAGRAASIQARYGVPFLLENPAHYLRALPDDPGITDEFGLMARILELSGCRQLLDLHNLYCNAINFGFDASRALDRIALDRVGEIHIAGGSWMDGFYMDAHDGRVPEPVWDLLEQALARAPNTGGVVFEMLEDHAHRLGPDAIARELERARRVWRHHRIRDAVAA